MFPVLAALAVLTAPPDGAKTGHGRAAHWPIVAPSGAHSTPGGRDLSIPLSRSIARRLPARLGARREPYARELARAIVREAHRRGLDPVALAVVGWIESDWQSWRTRAGDGSHGVFQLIAKHKGPREAAVLLLGCQPGPRISRLWRSWWPRRGKGEPCEAPEVAARRRKLGPWSTAELRDPVISAYVAAYEIRRHILSCHARRHKPHRHPACKGLGWLTRYSHYNSGWNPPRWYYLKRLCERYKTLRREIR